MDSSSERLTVLIFDALNQALASVDSFVALDDRTLITAEIAARLHYAGVTLPQMPGKARDLGPQTFGPAPGSDGDTRDWDADDDESGGESAC